MKTLDQLRANFQDPPRSFGPVPFWNLNDALESEDIRWALEELAKQGIAGVFLHPRTGMEVPYLSDKYWKAIEIALEECRRLGLNAWIYDEHNWPSGVAGGRVLNRHPEYRQIYLDYRSIHLSEGQTGKISLPPKANGLTVRAWQVETDAILDISNALIQDQFQWTAPAGEWETVVFFTDTFMGQLWSSSGAPWTRDEAGALDYLNPDAVQEFMQEVHESYRERFGDQFGDLIPGIFTDETATYYGWQWTARLPEKFQKRFHYNLIDHLHELVLPVHNYVKTRCDYHQLALDLYVEAYFSKISEWAGRHKLIFTGHMLYEDKLDFLPSGQGAFFQPLRQMQMPGVDFLGDRTGYESSEILATPNIGPKALSSLAHATGKKRTLVELYGGCGWGTSPSKYKNLLNWVQACGANFITPHASFLSIKGHRKRDFPASHFVQLPWWRYYTHFAQYIACLSYLNSLGRHVADIALFYPLRTFWVEHIHQKKTNVWKEISGAFADIATALLRIQRDYDFLFEETLLEGAAEITQDGLKVGEETFPIVILPPMTTVSYKVLDILRDFCQAGGILLALGVLPIHSTQKRDDARIRRLVEELFGPSDVQGAQDHIQHHPKGGQAVFVPLTTPYSEVNWLVLLSELLDTLHVPDARIDSPLAKEIIYQHRRLDHIDYYFFANLSEQESAVDLTLRVRGGVEIWHPESGKFSPWPACSSQKGFTRLRYEFAPYEAAYIFVSSALELNKDRPSVRSESDILPPIEIVDWQMHPEGSNLFLLEPWCVRLLDDPGGEERELLTSRYDSLEAVATASRRLAEAEGVDPADWTLFMRLARDPDFQAKSSLWPPEGSEFERKTMFHAIEPPFDLELVYEDLGEPLTLIINGKQYKGDVEPCFVWDRSNRKVRLQGWVHPGENNLILRTRMPAYRSLPPATHGLEPVVLQGSFRILNGSLADLRYKPNRLESWTQVGWPCYSGAMVYEASFYCPETYLDHRLFVFFEEVRETVEVQVNGQTVGVRLWPPYRLDITGFVTKGLNELKITVTNTLSNLLTRPLPSGLIGNVYITAGP